MENHILCFDFMIRCCGFSTSSINFCCFFIVSVKKKFVFDVRWTEKYVNKRLMRCLEALNFCWYGLWMFQLLTILAISCSFLSGFTDQINREYKGSMSYPKCPSIFSCSHNRLPNHMLQWSSRYYLTSHLTVRCNDNFWTLSTEMKVESCRF